MSGCIIKCPFCPTLNLSYYGIDNGLSSGNVPYAQRLKHRYRHDACHSDFYYDASFRLVAWVFKTQYRGDEFVVAWFEEDAKTTLAKNCSVIAEFTDRAHLTPFNLVQKLPTILTFM